MNFIDHRTPQSPSQNLSRFPGRLASPIPFQCHVPGLSDMTRRTRGGHLSAEAAHMLTAMLYMGCGGRMADLMVDIPLTKNGDGHIGKFPMSSCLPTRAFLYRRFNK